MKIYKNVKLYYWTYSSTLVNSQSLSFKQMFFCLFLASELHRRHTLHSLPSFSFSVCSNYTHSSILKNMHCTNPKAPSWGHVQIFPKQGRRSCVILVIYTLPPCLCEPTRNMSPSQWTLILPYHLSVLHRLIKSVKTFYISQ
jgi:hypothetical protein